MVSATPAPRAPRAAAPATRRQRRLLLALLLLTLLAAGAALAALDHAGFAPRVLGPYVLQRSSKHNPAIEAIGRQAADTLAYLDRGSPAANPPPVGRIGAQRGVAPASPAIAGAHDAVLVDTADELRAAIRTAQPGAVITILPGRYQFEGGSLLAATAGNAGAPITVRAMAPGSVTLEFAMVEGIKVSAPYWRFENLTIRGVCGTHNDCEHAFHVVGDAHHFIACNNTISDFNAHFKINGEGDDFPDFGLIEQNTLNNSTPRHTANPVTLIDLVAASHWIVRGNLISDFSKDGGNRVAFGAFFKGGGSNNRFEGNMVLCEALLLPPGGQRIGLSLGGGGTAPPYCRDRKCITEQSGSTIVANLIAACSDDGIYLNSAADSRVVHNTLVDTGGIDVRFATSSATVAGNLVDGAIRSRDGGLLHLDDNLDSATASLYLGLHPQRALFRAPAQFDWRWADDAPRRNARTPGLPDLCGGARPAAAAYGATENFAACTKAAP